MRISSNLFFRTGLNSINAQQADLVHLYKQVGSGQRMVNPSDDPLGAAQAINISQTLAMSERYGQNRQVALQNLGMQENVLNSATMQLQDIKTRLVEVGNGTLSDVDRAALAEVLQGSRDALLNLANSTDGNGQYLFSGSRGSRPAFSDQGTYIGDSSQRLIQADQTRQVAAVDLGSDIFNRPAPGATGFVMMPGANNQGSGAFGKITVTDPQGTAAGKRVEINFINEVDGAATQYTVSVDGGAPETHDIGDPPAKLLGGAYGVQVEFAGAPKANDKLTLVPLSSNYSVSKDSTMAVAGVSNLADDAPAFTISYDGANYTVSPSTLNVENVANPGQAPRLQITDTATPSAVVAEVALYDTPTPGSSATIEPGSGSVSREEFNIFATLDDLIKTLKEPTTGDAAAANLQNALNSAIQRVDATYNNVLSVRASAGTRMNELESLNANGSTRVMEYRNQLSKLEDLDYYTAITQLQLRTTALEAASMAFQKIQNTSLFNMNSRG